ncbi:hypothetical protein SeMB42_g05387 [Synchytrium endobioticum]|uniref:J domain-containing protein n=1 Tax=Synchytrium endobioticum TaxID=286115 RepID=A0A507CYH1_9FUNG|nr:hypothetical protein SeMB42_g05387 [Synchytrium endobioticum]TPX44223.1 hypothetical protein SeLEV6574_g04626 [Synchytrium endobioticum]
MLEKTFYEELDISSNATTDDIKKAYKKSALKCHPDKNGGDRREDFQRLAEIYEILVDPARRRAYDESLQRPSQPRAPPSHRTDPFELFEQLFNDDDFFGSGFIGGFNRRTRAFFDDDANVFDTSRFGRGFGSTRSSHSLFANFDDFFATTASSSRLALPHRPIYHTAVSSRPSNSRSRSHQQGHGDHRLPPQEAPRSDRTVSYGRFDDSGRFFWVKQTESFDPVTNRWILLPTE